MMAYIKRPTVGVELHATGGGDLCSPIGMSSVLAFIRGFRSQLLVASCVDRSS